MFKVKRRSIVLGIIAAAWPSGVAVAQMSYFEAGIDYWRHPGAEVAPIQPSATAAKTEMPVKSDAAFDWRRYLDPKNDEFFREGAYVPPAPFMEVARNPSDENLRQWFSYVAMKNAVASRLEQRMQEFTQGSGGKVAPEAAPVAQPAGEITMGTIDSKRFAMRFYFDSQCPHCRRMAPEIEKLRRLGFAIDARQVDQGAPETRPPLAIPVQYAAPDEVRQFGIQSVPVLLIADLQSKSVYRLPGYQSAEAVLRALPPDR